MYIRHPSNTVLLSVVHFLTRGILAAWVCILPLHCTATEGIQTSAAWVNSLPTQDWNRLSTNHTRDFAIRLLGTEGGTDRTWVVGRNGGGYYWLTLEGRNVVKTNRLEAGEVRDAVVNAAGELVLLTQTFVDLPDRGLRSEGQRVTQYAADGSIRWISDRIALDDGLLRVNGRGEVCVAGTWKRLDEAASDTDVVVYWFGARGELRWSLARGTISGTNKRVVDVDVTDTGDVCITGKTETERGSDAFMIRLSATGAVEWNRVLEGTELGWFTGRSTQDRGARIRILADGRALLLAFSSQPLLPGGDSPLSEPVANLFIAGINTTGEVEWSHRVGSENVLLDSVAMELGGGGTNVTVLAGHVSGTQLNAQVYRLSLDGTNQWSQSAGWTGYRSMERGMLKVDAVGNVVAGGVLKAPISGSISRQDFVFNYGLIKIAPEGGLLWQREATNWPDPAVAQGEVTLLGESFLTTRDGGVRVLRQTRRDLEGGIDLELLEYGGDGLLADRSVLDPGEPWVLYSIPANVTPREDGSVLYLEVQHTAPEASASDYIRQWGLKAYSGEGAELWSYLHGPDEVGISAYDFAKPLNVGNGETMIARVVGFGGDSKLEVVRIGTNGEEKWIWKGPWPDATWGPTAALDSAGNVVVVTGVEGETLSKTVRVLKLTSDGNLVWSREMLTGLSGRRDPWIGAGANETLFLVTSDPQTSTESRVALLDKDGALIRNQIVEGSSPYDAAVMDSAGNLYLTSQPLQNPAERDWVTWKFDGTGTMVGTNRIPLPSIATVNDLIDRGAIVFGGDGAFYVTTAEDRAKLFATGRVRYGDSAGARDVGIWNTFTGLFRVEATDVGDVYLAMQGSNAGYLVARTSNDQVTTHLIKVIYSPGIVVEGGIAHVNGFGEPGLNYVCRRSSKLGGAREQVSVVRATMLGDLRIADSASGRSQAFYEFSLTTPQ